MARKKGRTGSPTNLYLDDEVKKAATKLAFLTNQSLSSLVDAELRGLIARKKREANAQQKAA